MTSMSAASPSMFVVDVSKSWGPEYVALLADASRFVSIQFVIQLLLSSTDGAHFPLFSADFFLLLLFILVGVSFYHLVISRVVTFR